MSDESEAKPTAPKAPAPLPEELARYLQGSAFARLADSIAERAHAGQFRKDGTTPYIDHPREVAERFLGYARDLGVPAEEFEGAVCAALLHDVVEDTPVTRAKLAAQIDAPRVIELVDLLTKADPTRPADEAYFERISRDKMARALKFCDRIANLYDGAELPATPDNRRFWREYDSKTKRFQRYPLAGERVLDIALERAQYELRQRIALSDPWYMLVAAGGWSLEFWQYNNTNAPLCDVQKTVGGWVTVDDEKPPEQTEPRSESLGDISPHAYQEIGWDEPGGSISYDLSFTHEGKRIRAHFSVEPGDWFMPKIEAHGKTGMVFPADWSEAAPD